MYEDVKFDEMKITSAETYRWKIKFNGIVAQIWLNP